MKGIWSIFKKFHVLVALAIAPFYGSQAAEQQSAPKPVSEPLLTFKEIDAQWSSASFDEVTAAAERGDAVAQCQLGARFAMGRGVATNLASAVHWYHKAAQQGLAHAQFRLAMMYWDGDGVATNRQFAMTWMRKSAEQGYTLAECNLGSMCGNDYLLAAHWYEKAAKKGNAHAQFLLAELYHFSKLGFSVRSNCIEWYLKSAAQGHTKARAQAGRLSEYYPDHKVLKTAEVIDGLRKAAEKGNLHAQFELARRLRDGRDVLTNLVEAFKWMTLAASNKTESSVVLDASYELGCMYEHGQGVDKNLTEAWRLYLLAADWNPNALIRTGQMYEEGTGVPQDFEIAAERYFMGAMRWTPLRSNTVHHLLDLYLAGRGLPADKSELGTQLQKLGSINDASILIRLGDVYLSGKLVPKDIAAAVEHYTKAAEMGSPAAQNTIGNFWASERRNPSQAAVWYRQAAEQGLAEAQYNLAVCYASGDGVQANRGEAWFWFQLAALQGLSSAQTERAKLEQEMTSEELSAAKTRVAGFKPSAPKPDTYILR